MRADSWPPDFQGCRNLSALNRGFRLESKLLAKPSFSQKSFSSNSQEKEEDRIPPILFWADYFPFGINELSTRRSSCLVQITKSYFCFTRDNSNWCGSQLFGDKALCVTKKKECHCSVEIQVRLGVPSKFICPSLTEEFTVKSLIFTRVFQITNLYLKSLPWLASVSEPALKTLERGAVVLPRYPLSAHITHAGNLPGKATPPGDMVLGHLLSRQLWAQAPDHHWDSRSTSSDGQTRQTERSPGVEIPL